MSYITIQNLASEIWNDLGEPSSLSSSSIETKLLTSGYLGKFDLLTNTNHYIDYDNINSGQCITPELFQVEQAIYKQMYFVDYYTKKSTDIFSFNDGQTAGSWVSLKEGDSQISRANPTEIAKYYVSLSKESRAILDSLVDLYNRNRAVPESIDYLTIVNEIPKYNTYRNLS